MHVRAILGLPIPEVKLIQSAASRVILAEGNSSKISFKGVEKALQEKDTEIRLFGKPNSRSNRRMGVLLAADDSVEMAREKTERMLGEIQVIEE